MLQEQSLTRLGSLSSVLGEVALFPPQWPMPSEGSSSSPADSWRELEALERLQRAQAESILMLVHELRSPLAASKSMLATLRYLTLDDEQRERLLARIEKRLEQVLDLVTDVLDLSQAKNGQPLEDATELDLVTKTRSICEPYVEDADRKGLAMTVDLPSAPVQVRILEQAYQLIVSNLVSNAVKYTPTGSVRVTLQLEEPWAVLEVEDSGIGIPQGEIPLLLTEFFRASNARRGRIPGTGLGLAGVKALVERCGGELTVESEEQMGSRFRVRLPLCNTGTT
jgi:signal transduction histidine kinase